MRLLVDLETGAWSTWANAQTSSISLRRRDRLVVAVRFGRGGQVVEWPENAAGTFAIKLEFGGQFVALAPFWTPSGYGADRHYSFDVNLNTQELEALFAEEPASVSLLAEVSVTSGAQIFSSETLRVVVTNDVIRGDEGTPAAAIELKATQAEAEAGTNNETWMTPLRTKEAIIALSSGTSGTTDFNELQNVPSTFPPASHTHPANQISDSTGSGRTLLTSNLVGARAHLSFFPSFANRASFPVMGDVDRVYTALDTAKIYVWIPSISDYLEVSPSINADWNATSGAAQILNKPSIPNTTPHHIIAACSDETSALTTGDKLELENFFLWNLNNFRASVTDAPTGSSIIVTLTITAPSVTPITLAATISQGTKYGSAAFFSPFEIDAVPSAPWTFRLAVTQIGSTNAGKGLKVYLEGTRPL
jgi:hypothetical protein